MTQQRDPRHAPQEGAMMVTRYIVPNKIRARGGLMQAQEEVRMVMASDYDALQQAYDQLKDECERFQREIANRAFSEEELRKERDQLRAFRRP